MAVNFFNNYTDIVFQIKEQNGKNRIFIKEISFSHKKFINIAKGIPVSHIAILGEAYDTKYFNRYADVGETLEFVSTQELSFSDKKQLIIQEKNEKISVKTIFTLENNNGVLSVKTEVINIKNENITFECVAPLVLNGLMLDENTFENDNNEENVLVSDNTAILHSRKFLPYHRRPRFFKAHNSWCMEAIFEEVDLDKEGMRGKERTKRAKRIVIGSNGSQTTNSYLPLGIFQKDDYGYFMFEILPEGSWSYEIETGISDTNDNEIFLCLSGKNLADNAWYKTVKSGETYHSEEIRIVGATDLDEILLHITKNKRNAKCKNAVDVNGKVIYNIFQQNCGPFPSAKKDEKWIPLAAEAQADYYVVDAGWFDNGSTLAIGVWDECKELYPDGLIKSVEKIRERKMKFGLWVELQSVGIYCEKKDILPEYCFFHINGVRPVCNGRYQLNYAYKEVRDYADGIIKKLVDRYDVDYIKIDYNQTQLGNDCETGSYTEGLAEHIRGYLKWFKEIQEKYPNIVFETCASGGMMMDSNIGKLTTVFSISDQAEYYNYPIIIANVPFISLPEQNGIWCIPVGGWKEEDCCTSDEQVIMNAVNSFYGIMHLCSRIDRLTETQKELLAEGIAYYREISKIKLQAIPVMINGFALCDDEIVFTGLKTDDTLYVSVYNLSHTNKSLDQDLKKYGVKSVTLDYPKKANNEYSLNNGVFHCELSAMTARSFSFNIF